MGGGNQGQALELLVSACTKHGIDASREEILRALNDDEHGAAFAEWATTHLGPDNLLTAEELALYTTLDKNGQVDRLAASRDLAEVQAFTDEEIRTAVEDLNRSTVNIAKQTEVLRQQQAALSRLTKKTSDNAARRKDLDLTQKRKSDGHGKKLAKEVEELCHSLDLQVSYLEQRAQESTPRIAETVNAVLEKDDTLLSSLQKLGWELDQQDPEEAETVSKLREICMRLIKHTVETARTRLDRVYLESLAMAEPADQPSPSAEDVKALEEEVESLYSEILPVAQMSVEQQYLEPALRSISNRSGDSVHRSAAAVTYIDECLNHLMYHLELLASRISTFKSHNAATETLAATARAELSVPTDTGGKDQPPVEASPVRNVSPRRKGSQSSRKARRRSSGIQPEPPLEALCQSLAIKARSEEDTSYSDRVRDLASLLQERSTKSEEVARNAQENYEGTVMGNLEDVRVAMQLLRDSLLAESPYGRITLVDPEIEESSKFLSQEVVKVKSSLDDAETKRISQKSDKREEILQRWGR